MEMDQDLPTTETIYIWRDTSTGEFNISEVLPPRGIESVRYLRPLTRADLERKAEGEGMNITEYATQAVHIINNQRREINRLRWQRDHPIPDPELELLRRLVAKGYAVVNDFLPNVGRCALQDYERLNTFMVDAARYKDK